MRQAIKDTNVVLNMAITPGVILVPSDMIIIKKKIPGFNNILTLATGDMTFGTNLGVNVVEDKTSVVKGDVKTTPALKIQINVKGTLLNPQDKSMGFEEYVIAGVVVSVVTRYIVSFVVG